MLLTRAYISLDIHQGCWEGTDLGFLVWGSQSHPFLIPALWINPLQCSPSMQKERPLWNNHYYLFGISLSQALNGHLLEVFHGGRFGRPSSQGARTLYRYIRTRVMDGTQHLLHTTIYNVKDTRYITREEQTLFEMPLFLLVWTTTASV